MTREDEIARNAVRKSTLKSLKLKKKLRIKQIREEADEKIREINIQYAEDPERLRAKYAADDYAKSEKARKRAEKAIKREKELLEKNKKLRPLTIGEEIFSSIVQGIGFALFIAATALLDVIALDKVPASFNARKIYMICYSLFGSFCILNYLMSVLHHALTPASAKEVFRRLCRVSIYFIIASAFTVYSYTAIKANSVNVIFGFVLTLVVWIVCTTGVFISSIGGEKFEVVNVILYAVLGWSGLLIFGPLYHVISKTSFSMLIFSGIFYTLGLVFCSIRKVKYMHGIGNLVILSGSVYMFFSFFFMF